MLVAIHIEQDGSVKYKETVKRESNFHAFFFHSLGSVRVCGCVYEVGGMLQSAFAFPTDRNGMKLILYSIFDIIGFLLSFLFSHLHLHFFPSSTFFLHASLPSGL